LAVESFLSEEALDDFCQLVEGVPKKPMDRVPRCCRSRDNPAQPRESGLPAHESALDIDVKKKAVK
jgi:hypothetical protein